MYFLFVALSLSTVGVRFADKWYKFSVINKLAVLYSYSPRHHHQYKCLLKELERLCSGGGKGLIKCFRGRENKLIMTQLQHIDIVTRQEHCGNDLEARGR